MKYLTEKLADHAEAFIKQQQALPFFVYLAFNAEHTPMHATEEYLERFEKTTDPKWRTYAAMLSAMDDAVGRVMAALRFFFSDNGGPTMPTTTVNGSINRPLRGSNLFRKRRASTAVRSQAITERMRSLFCRVSRAVAR